VIRVYGEAGIQIDCRSAKESAGEQNKKGSVIRPIAID
jgi:hypothetical protein